MIRATVAGAAVALLLTAGNPLLLPATILLWIAVLPVVFRTQPLGSEADAQRIQVGQICAATALVGSLAGGRLVPIGGALLAGILLWRAGRRMDAVRSRRRRELFARRWKPGPPSGPDDRW